MKTVTIEICSRCEGKGYYDYEELVNPHKGDYDITRHKCLRCEGSGLLEITVVTERKVAPYKPPVIE